METPGMLIYHCWLCAEEFFDKLSILKHLKRIHEDRKELMDIEKKMKVPMCVDCGSTEHCEHTKIVTKNPSVEEQDEDDLNRVSKPRMIKCVTCAKSFTFLDSLHKHRIMEHPAEKPYQCTFCPDVYSEKSELVTHKLVHAGARPYICHLCGNRFPKCSDLKRHSLIHTRYRPFQCAKCDKTFTQKSTLEKHAKVHAKQTGGHPCLLCGLVFQEPAQLKEHCQTSHGNVSFCCKICGKMYMEERHLLLHEKNHFMVKPHACSFCDQRFSLRSLLERHEERIHLSRKDIICDICGKTFKRTDNLNRHKISHTGVKSHKCELCGISFTEKGSLTRHVKSQHDLLRPHTCTFCGKSFTRKTLVRKHIERCHEPKASREENQRAFFQCKLCGKNLRLSGKRQHIKLHEVKGEKYEEDEQQEQE